MIQVYTPQDAREAGVFIEDDAPPAQPPTEPVAETNDGRACITCKRPVTGKLPWGICRVYTEANGLRWYEPWWTCRHNEGDPRPYLICEHCMAARLWQHCPVCGCREEYT